MVPLLLALPAIARGQCGGAGEPCGTNSACNSGFACNPVNMCELCGGDRQLCCATPEQCTTGNVCDGTLCHACGGTGEPCCPGCNSGFACDPVNTCVPCGDTNERCCDSSTDGRHFVPETH